MLIQCILFSLYFRFLLLSNDPFSSPTICFISAAAFRFVHPQKNIFLNKSSIVENEFDREGKAFMVFTIKILVFYVQILHCSCRGTAYGLQAS